MSCVLSSLETLFYRLSPLHAFYCIAGNCHLWQQMQQCNNYNFNLLVSSMFTIPLKIQWRVNVKQKAMYEIKSGYQLWMLSVM